MSERQHDEPSVRLLLVEDDADDAELLRVELMKRGIETELTRVDTEVALRGALSKGNWDIVVSDYSMPTFDGMRACRITQETRPEVPFIFVSGSLGEERAVEAMRAGARDCIFKGAHYSRVAQAIRREIQLTESRRQLAPDPRPSDVLRAALDATGAGVFQITLEPADGTSSRVRCAWIWGGRVQPLLESALESLSTLGAPSTWLDAHVMPEDREGFEAMWSELVEGEDLASHVVRIRGDNWRWLEVHLSMRVLSRDADGSPTRLLGVAIDASRTVAPAPRTSSAPDLFRTAKDLIHDLRHLLSTELGFAYVVADKDPAQESARAYLAELLESARRLTALTGQIHGLARQHEEALDRIAAATPPSRQN